MSPPMPARVLLVRHGATEWSVDGRHTGSTDIDLTAEGRREAVALGVTLHRMLEHDTQPPLVFSSPLGRSLETARTALAEHSPEVTDALKEFDYGIYEGLTTAEIRAKVPDWELFSHGCPEGESLPQVVARADSFVAKLERVAVGRTVVAFTHGHFSRVLTARLIGLPGITADILFNDTASIALVEERRGLLVLRGWNVIVVPDDR
jgi:broad specificity phosphatase PhoE